MDTSFDTREYWNISEIIWPYIKKLLTIGVFWCMREAILSVSNTGTIFARTGHATPWLSRRNNKTFCEIFCSDSCYILRRIATSCLWNISTVCIFCTHIICYSPSLHAISQVCPAGKQRDCEEQKLVPIGQHLLPGRHGPFGTHWLFTRIIGGLQAPLQRALLAIQVRVVEHQYVPAVQLVEIHDELFGFVAL